MSQSHEAELRRMARERIDHGQLRCDPPGHTWGGRGSGLHCSLCDGEIPPSDVEYEVEFATQASHKLYRFHLPCYEAWMSECGHDSQRVTLR